MPSGVFSLKQQVAAIRQGAWTNRPPTAVNYLVVAGGGGGAAGGGGAGGLLAGFSGVATGTQLWVTVGAGGTAGNGTSGGTAASNGGNSVLLASSSGATTGNIVSTGGGAGGVVDVSTGSSGGSGGGGSGGGSGKSGGSGISGQGNAGAKGPDSSSRYPSSGGGGAGTIGIAALANGNSGGNGGAGIASSISGAVVTYAGGGGGASFSGSGPASSGGIGGGGNGGYASNGGTSGTANTGGGGGGGGNGQSGGTGGSGIVIISYPDTYTAAASTTGSPTVSTSGSGSLYFNGSSRWINYANQSAFAFGTGDWTIECWVYIPTAGITANPMYVFDCRPAGTSGAYATFNFAAGQLIFSNGTSTLSAGVLNANTWYHVAICRTGTSTRSYLNGTQSGSTLTDSVNYLVGTNRPAIGTDASNVGTSNLNAYISNFRVVKGVCVYTGAFTPPTAPLQATQPAGTNIAAITGTSTSLLLNCVSGALFADSSTNGFSPAGSATTVAAWDSLSPFATGLGYKNRVYTWTSSGSITF